MFATSPNFNLQCTGDSEGKYGYDLVEGEDYTVRYFDSEDNELAEKPAVTGDYYVQFVGNNRASWGSTDKIKFTIQPSIIGAVVTSDEDGAAYYYDGEAHSPAIKVALGSSTLQEGVSYSVSYMGEDGELRDDAPTAPGVYTAIVKAKQPSTGGMLGQVKFSIKAHQLQGGTLSVANLAANDDGSAVTPELKVTGKDGEAVPAIAYTVSYEDSKGNAVDAASLATPGKYKAVVAGVPEGASGQLETDFAIVKAGNAFTSAVQDGALTYNGQAQTPRFKFADAQGNVVAVGDNYSVTYVDKNGNAVAPDALVNAGTYTATVAAAANSEYAGSATCEVTIGAQDVSEQLQVTLNRTVFDYQSTPEWEQSEYVVDSTTRIGRKSKAPDVVAAVKLGDATLTEGVDYTIKQVGNITSSLDDKDSHEATLTVELLGNYSGEVSQKYTVNKRIEHVVEHRGVKFSYAVNNDGTAVITGLGVDLDADSTQEDIAKAYTSAFDPNEGVFIPGSIEVDGKTLQVVGVSDCAFSLPGYAANSGRAYRDVWNGAKKLTVEKGIKEIGYSALNLDTDKSKVTAISLPEGLETIHTWGIGASKAEEIVVPASVKSIGSFAFGGMNSGMPYLKSFRFADGSNFTEHSEGYWATTSKYDYKTNTETRTQSYDSTVREIVAGIGGDGDSTTADRNMRAPMEEVTVPASYSSSNWVFYKFANCLNYYFMGDSFASDCRVLQMNTAADDLPATIWGWDTSDNGLSKVSVNQYSPKLSFRPFAVLGNTASDTFKYTEAWNDETQTSNGTKDYAANTFVGTPVATNHGDEVTVDWNLDTKFVNSDYSWTPEEGTDFTVKYQKAGSTEQVDKITEAGTYTATLTGNGKTCFGTATATVQVDALSLEGANVAVDGKDLVYTGAGQTPDVEVTLTQGEGESAYEIVLQPGTDYKVEYVNNVDATDSETHAVARVVGCGLYAGTADGEFAIAKAPLSVTAPSAAKTFGQDDPEFKLADDAVTGLVGGDTVVSAKFTREVGEVAGAYAIKCTGIDIKDKSGKRLVTDNYQVTYKDGTLAISGQAAVDISGDASEISPIADQVLYGSEVRPSVTVKVGGKELVEGTDYVVSYKGNNAVGKATATVTGIGSYAGAKTVEFNVVAPEQPAQPTDISSAEVAPIADQVLYGSEVRPSVTVKVGGKELVEGTDYVVSYKGNNAVGKATATVTGIGSYAGAKTVEFNVVAPEQPAQPTDISSAEVAPIADQVLYGSEVRPSVTVKVGGKELVEGTDYVVSYKGNNAVGKATATVTGIGSYAGTKTVEFNVIKFVQFPDVQESDWFYGSVISAVRAGYMNGYENGLFGPNDTLTRGQAACVLANMAGADGSVAYDGQYADVTGNEYYAANTAWAKKAGVMSGYAGTENFGPADNLTREQMACALYNYARDVDGKDVSVADAEATIAKFSDGDFVSGYATEAVAWAIEHGIMGNGGFINAQGDISRAEMAAMAVNYMTTVHED